jgi:hypothetical protein
VKFALTEQLLDEAHRFGLRSACCDCFYWRPDRGGRIATGTTPETDADARTIVRGACAHDWPDEGQRRWPLDAPNPDGSRPTEVAFCKEFELR